MKATARTLCIVAATALLLGCLSVETVLHIDADGSGTIELTYRIDREAYNLGVFDQDSSIRPLPVTRADFTRAATHTDGIALDRYGIEDDQELGQVIVRARIAFDSIRALNEFYAPGATPFSLAAGGGRTHFTQLLIPGGGAPDSSLADDLERYTLTFSINAPATIVTASFGDVAENGHSVTAHVTLAEIASRQTPLIWEVEW